MSWLNFIRDFLKNEDGAPPKPDPKGPSADDASGRKSAREMADALVRRLQRERSLPDVRRLYQNAQQLTNLADEMISLMFFVPRPQGGGLTHNWLLDALRERSSLTLHRNVFYIYVDINYPLEIEREIGQVFYDRFFYLMEYSDSLRDFVNDRFSFYQAKAGTSPIEAFDQTQQAHRLALRRLFLTCYFSVSRKEFASGFKDQAFIVGRRMLHDESGITDYEYERRRERQQARRSGQAEAEEKARLAVTVKTLWKEKGRRISLNAHRFNWLEDRRPETESELYIGNWQSDWDFSIGSAEHDEIKCDALDADSDRASLKSLRVVGGNRWDCDFIAPSARLLPRWFKCHYGTDEPQLEDGHVAVLLQPKGVLDIALDDYLNRTKFPQALQLMGRVILNNSPGQSEELAATGDAALRNAVEGIAVTSALQVTPDFWVVLAADNAVWRLVRRSTSWDREAVRENVRTELSPGFDYRFVRGSNLGLPRVHSIIYLIPPDREVRNYMRTFNVDEGAATKVAYRELFPTQLLPDRMLGSEGVVSVACTRVVADGRGVYALRPTAGASNPFFAFQPVSKSDPRWARYNKSWLVYDVDRFSGEPTGDLRIGPDGCAAFDGEVVTAEEYGYNLICGTSFFQLKISGTPHVGTEVAAMSVSSRPPAPQGETAGPESATAAEQSAVAAEFVPTEKSVGMRLLNTRWATHVVIEAHGGSRSNYAAHFWLTGEDGDRRFLKAYYANSVGSAVRESGFYEKYGPRAAELYIRPPDEALHLRPGDSPWGLIFPRLTPLDEEFPEGRLPTLAQTVAIGYGMAALLRALSDDRLINFDVDKSTLCFDPGGRLVVVDFDNVYPMLSENQREAELAALKGVIDAGQLPAKSTTLPPEALAFASSKGYERMEALTRIGAPFHTYLLAVVLLELRKRDESVQGPNGLTVATGAFAGSAAAEGVSPDSSREFQGLLIEMLRARPGERPTPDALVSRLRGLALKFAAESARARTEVAGLLGEDFFGDA